MTPRTFAPALVLALSSPVLAADGLVWRVLIPHDSAERLELVAATDPAGAAELAACAQAVQLLGVDPFAQPTCAPGVFSRAIAAGVVAIEWRPRS